MKVPSLSNHTEKENEPKPTPSRTNAKSQCARCKKMFARKFCLKRHSKVCQRKTKIDLSCKICQKIFDRPSKLKRHEKKHAPKVVYNCSSCDRYYVRKDKWIKHVRSCRRVLRVEDSEESAAEETDIAQPLMPHTINISFTDYDD